MHGTKVKVTQAFFKTMKQIYYTVKKKLKMKHFSVVKNVV